MNWSFFSFSRISFAFHLKPTLNVTSMRRQTLWPTTRDLYAIILSDKSQQTNEGDWLQCHHTVVYRSRPNLNRKICGIIFFCSFVSVDFISTFYWLHARPMPCKVTCALMATVSDYRISTRIHTHSHSPGGKRHIARIFDFYLFSTKNRKDEKQFRWIYIGICVCIMCLQPTGDIGEDGELRVCVCVWMLLNFIILFSDLRLFVLFLFFVVKRNDLMWKRLPPPMLRYAQILQAFDRISRRDGNDVSPRTNNKKKLKKKVKDRKNDDSTSEQMKTEYRLTDTKAAMVSLSTEWLTESFSAYRLSSERCSVFLFFVPFADYFCQRNAMEIYTIHSSRKQWEHVLRILLFFHQHFFNVTTNNHGLFTLTFTFSFSS